MLNLELFSLLHIRRLSIIDFHTAAFPPMISREAKPSNIPLLPIVIPEDVRNNGTLRDRRLARSRCIIHRETSTGTFNRGRNATSADSVSEIVTSRDRHPRWNIGTTKRPRETTGTESSQTEVVVIVVSRLKPEDQPSHPEPPFDQRGFDLQPVGRTLEERLHYS